MRSLTGRSWLRSTPVSLSRLAVASTTDSSRRQGAVAVAIKEPDILPLHPPPRVPPSSSISQDVANSSSSSSQTTAPSSSSVVLRPYQEQAVQECLDAIATGTTRIGVSSPTGSGKTTMFTELIHRLPDIHHDGEGFSSGSRVLVIVNSIELAVQAASAVSRTYPHLLVEIDQGAKFKATGVADVTVATYQTLTRSENRLGKYSRTGLKGIIVDEAHHAASKSYIHLLSQFDDEVGLTREQREERASEPSTSSSSSSAPRIPIIGFSATFARHDGLALGRVFDRIVYHRDFLTMIDEQWLCPVRFTSIKSNLDLSDVKVSSNSGDFLPTSLADYTNTPAINRLIVRSWLDRASDRRSTLVFCVNIQHTMDLTTTFREAGIDARYLHGGTPMKARKQLLQDFKDGQFKVLINCAILTEGFDLPQIDVVLMARPTRSRNLFSQMIGRGLRLSPQTGKTDCLILDLVGTIERGVVCTPTLFGLDPMEDVDGMTLEDLKAKMAEDEEGGSGEKEAAVMPDIPDPTEVTFLDYDSPRELQNAVTRRGGNEYINRLSPNAWVDCGGAVYILEIPRKGFIRVQRGPPSTSDDAEDDDEINVTPSASSTTWSATFTAQNADYEEAAAAGQARKGGFVGKRPGFSLYRRPYSILGNDQSGEAGVAPDLETCVRICDTYATKHVLRSGPMNTLIRRDAEWRKALASTSQRLLVAKRLGYGSPSADEDGKGKIPTKDIKDLDHLTKGDASTILTKLKFGFKQRWKMEVKAWNREAKAQEKELQRRQKEMVQVGDL